LQRIRETEAFLSALDHTAPRTVSACDGWTAHEITAHLTAVAVEVTRHLEPFLEGRPVPATASFDQREPPFRALGDRELRNRLEGEEVKVHAVIDHVLQQNPDAVIPWTGRPMPVAKFIPHLRNEFAVHRWDIMGDDDVSFELLAQPELTEHSITVLGTILLAKGSEHDPGAGNDFCVRLRSGDTRDVRLMVVAGDAALHAADQGAHDPDITLDAAARLLVMWGRRPSPPGRINSQLTAPALTRFQTLLAGY
jgi:mycothiol maleylpyruvate isomerase-like protein